MVVCGRLPGGWHGESLGAARENHAHALSPRVRAKTQIVGEDRRLESDRFYEKHGKQYSRRPSRGTKFRAEPN